MKKLLMSCLVVVGAMCYVTNSVEASGYGGHHHHHHHSCNSNWYYYPQTMYPSYPVYPVYPQTINPYPTYYSNSVNPGIGVTIVRPGFGFSFSNYGPAPYIR